MTSSAAELVSQIHAYYPDADPKPIEDAVEFAKVKHEGQVRSSGEPYYTHPLEVAGILADMKMDPATIITAILHDTLEDTNTTYEEIEKKFSPEVASLVNGVSKLTKIESQTVEGKQAENFRKLLLAMSEDIRVLLVKLADRLHNMRTLHHIAKPEKRFRISRETLDIYAPLAERVGLHKIKEDLEDLAFSYLNSEARDSITNRLSFLRQEGSDLVNMVIRELTSLIHGAGINGQVTGREKTRYSIWKKMQRKNVSFEQLSDIMAFRIVVDTVAECYHALGVVHSQYSVVPGRFKDYISTPKPNGYRSIHTTVIGPENQRIEIQVRTHEMHAEADLGVAAHWAYKQTDVKSAINEAKKYRWMRELLDILEQDQRPEDFWENTKLELFQEQVFAFTPKGDLFELPTGSTPIDFAYAIHSDVGNRCIGAKINGRIAPLNTKLQNGDQVEIVTAKTQNPSPTWERFVVTGKARSHIRRFIRQQQRSEYMILGKAMLQKVFKTEGYEFTDKAVSGVVDQYRECENADDIYSGIGSGNIVARDVFRSIFPAHKSDQEQKVINPEDIPTIKTAQNQPRSGKLQPMPIKGLIPGMAVHFARCCHPLPGDRIVGIVTTGKGVTVHTIDCETLEQFADTPERWIDVSWGEGQNNPENRVGRLMVTIANTPGALGTISTVIGKSGGNITNLKITSRSVDFWDMYLDVSVNDTKHLNNIVAALRATPQVVSVERARGR
ncbi:MAG: bifunctional (p)ppGpp synthetase/guanosine-3',5'-bis(diphosphate) 3'-pyrophosphohydrolase [Alphaproteobacteria bacterium CG1_02_46_17]|nr:MAG: bifunctional (p)ppGpp synthetase/guanosine-3',5'-bis(diphosphate) 3'-pyrophosphohydrolase [Alphaproteobacteria bacterium CG1_02_46_17]